jgi:cytochrome c551
MKMKIVILMIAVYTLIAVTGCSKTDNYTPPDTISGEEMFSLNCTKCHKPEVGAVMRLSADKISKEAIIKKINSGGMTMPAFPNIKGEPAERLAKYILENSKPK